MRKCIQKLFVLTISFIFLTNVNAASKCSNNERSEINSIIANVKAKYEEAQRTLDKSEYYVPDSIKGTEEEETYEFKVDYFRVNIYNITDKIYAVITNNANKDSITLTSADVKNGAAGFDWTDRSQVVTFTIKLYTSTSTSCPNELYRTLYLTLPRLNEYYYMAECEENPKFNLCEKYVTYSEVSDYDFQKRLFEYKNKTNKNEDEDTKQSFWEKNKIEIIIGGIVLVVIAGVATVKVIQRKRSSEI